ncbi:MAG: hypothetical protein KC505_10405 [Myxococcales bacterium]|nr:hypothetical protein [Myxococcales bacterium]USN50411.1 MAG: hypothetical protein H6731_09130 [Myxococcales bacterium]
MKLRFCLLSLLSMFLFNSCGLKNWIAKEFMQGAVADGVSRLSAQHMSMILSEVNKKFDTAEAKFEILRSQDAKEYGKGLAVWTLDNVEINYPKEESVYSDCNGDKWMWRGKVVVSAKKTIQGRITNNPKDPMLPDLGKVAIEVSGKAHDLAIHSAGSQEALDIKSGDFSFTAYPRLAQANAKGVPLKATSNNRFEGLRLKNMKGILKTNDVEMEVDIDNSDLVMQMGEGENGHENYLDGYITIFGNNHHVPSDGKGLDPNYESAKFMSTYDCQEHFKEGVSFEQVPLERLLAPPIGALSARTLGIIAGALEDNSECGFLGQDAAHNLVLEGNPGEKGSLSASLSKTCPLTFAAFTTKPNCFGYAYELNGEVTIESAKKKITGIVMKHLENLKEEIPFYEQLITENQPLQTLKNNFPQAVMPDSKNSAHIELKVNFNNLSIKEVCDKKYGSINHAHHCSKIIKGEDKKSKKDSTADGSKSKESDSKKAKEKNYEPIEFSIFSGIADAILEPMLAKDLREDAATKSMCAIPTSISKARVNLDKMTSSIKKGTNDMHFHVHGAYDLINGKIGDQENQQSGMLNVNDMEIPLKTSSQNFALVDENYVRSTFLDSIFSCDDSIALVENDKECALEDGMAENVARLLVMNAGALLKVATSSSIPGSLASFNAVRTRQLEDNEKRLIMKASHQSEINVGEKIEAYTDGLNVRYQIKGFVDKLEGTMTRIGVPLNERQGWLDRINPLNNRFVDALRAKMNKSQEIFVRPVSPRSTSIDVKAHLKNFTIESQRPNKNKAEYHLVIEDGFYYVSAQPIMGVDARTASEANISYSISTPVVEFKNIKIFDASARVEGHGMSIPLKINEAQLCAFNGRFSQEGNYVEGRIQFSVGSDTKEYSELKELEIKRVKLDPDFSQQQFDQSYAVTPHLYKLISAE